MTQFKKDLGKRKLVLASAFYQTADGLCHGTN